MEDINESSSSKHQNSDLDDDGSSIDIQNKLTEATDEAENALDLNRISDEAENPLTVNKISGEAQGPVILNKISSLADNTLIHNIVSGEAVDPLIQNKTSGDASPTSFSSSSHLLELDYDENAFDISFSISEEDEDNPNTRQWSMVSASPVPLSPENGSPKQSPVPQVMERSSSYDPDRIPASTFTRKSTNNTEWSADSSDSLFSIHDLGRSGELNRTDSSFHLPTVVETSEIDQKSTMGEIQNQNNDVPIVHSNENNGVSPSEKPCDSNTTPPSPPPPAPPPVPEGNTAEEPKSETKSGNCVPLPKGRCKCFNCFSSCTFCG